MSILGTLPEACQQKFGFWPPPHSPIAFFLSRPREGYRALTGRLENSRLRRSQVCSRQECRFRRLAAKPLLPNLLKLRLRCSWQSAQAACSVPQPLLTWCSSPVPAVAGEAGSDIPDAPLFPESPDSAYRTFEMRPVNGMCIGCRSYCEIGQRFI